jgi:hypothetical protein
MKVPKLAYSEEFCEKGGDQKTCNHGSSVKAEAIAALSMRERSSFMKRYSLATPCHSEATGAILGAKDQQQGHQVG